MLTFGLGWLLSPVGLVLSVVALRRVPRPGRWLAWLGVFANALLVVPAVIWVIPAFLARG